MKERKVPMRMCTGCGEMKPKKTLVRIVRSAEGEISFDKTGKKAGRGAYICNDPECFRKARKAKRLEKAFNCAIPDTVYAQLEEAISADGK
jgi:predicted RNA-binding protein YlxR (DUF448 family)